LKKLTFNISLFFLVILLVSVVFYMYIQPNEELNLQSTKIDVNEKIKHMVLNMKTEVIFSEDEIDSIIKMKLDPQINKNTVIEGARFYIEDDLLHANLNIKYIDKIRAAINVKYSFELDKHGYLRLQPLSVHLKDIKLPVSLLNSMEYQLYDMDNSVIKVTEIENEARQLIIKWKFDLF